MKNIIKIQAPLTDDTITNLRIGDKVSISGTIYTARDLAHKKMLTALEKGESLPFNIIGQIIYYVGPTPPPPNKVIGAAGPTTSSRMDPFTPALLANGLKGMIGKGPRNQYVLEALVESKAVYFAAVGGAAALLSKCITKAEVIAYNDLGPEAIRRLEVKDFPAIVANDCYGGNLFKTH